MKLNRKPEKKLRIKYHTDYSNDNVFASKARLLQSIWRTERGYEFEKYGNYLRRDFAKNTGKNFLTERIWELVKKEVANKSKNKKVIQEPRIWNNLLSSQPMAFNLFGELKFERNIATEIFRKLIPTRSIKKILSTGQKSSMMK
jgi:hypothetical protein